MEPENSLPRSQEHSTGPHPEPDQSSPYSVVLSPLANYTDRSSEAVSEASANFSG
jgi:hypothetical protein